VTLRRIGATVAALAIALSACGLTLDRPSSSIKPASPSPSASAAASVIAFRPTAYPADADAPCANREAYVGSLKRIRAVDARTVVFELCNPDAAFRSRIATPALAIQDTAWLQSRIPNGTMLGEANGTGPYRLDRWTRGAEVVFARNESWWGPEPKPAAVVIVWNADPSRRLADLKASTVDGMDQVAPSDVPGVQANPDLVLLPRVGLNTAYLGMSNRSKPFDDVRVRQAIAIGIDRQLLVDAAYPPGSQVARQFTPCSVPYGCAGAAWPEPDPSAARDLLEAAGFPTGFATTLTYPDAAREYLPDPAALAEALRAQLAVIGIVATVQAEPPDTFLEKVDGGKSPGLFLLGTRARFADVTEFLDRNFGSNAVARFGTPDRELTTALAKGAITSDASARIEAYTTANDAIRKHLPMVPLAHAGSNVAYRADVADAPVSPIGMERFAPVTPGDRGQITWTQEAEPLSLYCADEVDVASLRACSQMAEPLFSPGASDGSIVPSLAEACVPDASLTVWTCSLRPGVTFHDGSRLDASDVVLSFAVQWDAKHALHRGRTGDFQAFLDRFRGFLNPPAP
jgi:peptide/nickel transport system substrate-binding protein